MSNLNCQLNLEKKHCGKLEEANKMMSGNLVFLGNIAKPLVALMKSHGNASLQLVVQHRRSALSS